MVVNMNLTVAEVRIIQNMINFLDSLPSCADELLQCDAEVYNKMSDKFESLSRRVIENA